MKESSLEWQQYYCNSLFTAYLIPPIGVFKVFKIPLPEQFCLLSNDRTISLPPLQKLHWLPIHNRVKLYVVYHHFQGSENRQPSYSTCLTYFNFIILKDLFALLISCFSTHPKSKLPLPLAPFRMLRLSTWNSLPFDLRSSSSLH